MSTPNINATSEDFEFAALSEARNYRKSIIKHFSPYIKGRVMEVGAGIGQTSEEILAIPDITELVGVEPDQGFQNAFRERLPHIRLIEGTTSDLPESEEFDAAVLVNVLEHIEKDVEELIQLRKFLKERNGHLCLLVPARQEIYSNLDAHFGHFRRYSTTEIRSKLVQAGFKITQLSYFNSVGYLAWWLRFKLMGSMSFDVAQVRLYDQRIFPVVNWLETNICRPPIGQSVIAIAKAL